MQVNEIRLFENPEFGSVRAMEIDGESWFVGRDICKLFGDKNESRSLGRVDDADKQTIQIMDAMGRMQNAIIVNESGLYSLLFAMQPQKANHDGVSDAYPIEIQQRIEKLRGFKRWVTHDVIPSIRKHGAYMTADTIKKAMQSPDFIIQLATELKSEQEKNRQLETANAMKDQQIKELKPRADYTDKILKNKGLVTVSQIAKDYGMSAQQMNKKLYELGVQYKQSGQWLLYSRYHDKGYTHSETINITRNDGRPGIKMETKWTQKGRLFIYGRLKSVGILPVIEREDDDEC
jgi:prophage antirepressor-like protein